MAVAPSVVWLSVASFAVGATAATVQVIVPFAAHHAPDRERGRIVGTVLGGLLVGALLARTFSGVFGSMFGWRHVYWVASGMMIGLAVVIRVVLPVSPPSVSLSWPRLMRSVADLAREHAVLRESALLAGLLFFTFAALWTTLVFLLRTPPYHYGTSAAGTFGLLGAASASTAPIVGRLSDRGGPERTVLIAIVMTLVGYVLLLIFGRTSRDSSPASFSWTSEHRPGMSPISRASTASIRLRAGGSTLSTWCRSSSAGRWVRTSARSASPSEAGPGSVRFRWRRWLSRSSISCAPSGTGRPLKTG